MEISLAGARRNIVRGIATKSFHQLDNSFAAPVTSGARSICIMHVCVCIYIYTHTHTYIYIYIYAFPLPGGEEVCASRMLALNLPVPRARRSFTWNWNRRYGLIRSLRTALCTTMTTGVSILTCVLGKTSLFSFNDSLLGTIDSLRVIHRKKKLCSLFSLRSIVSLTTVKLLLDNRRFDYQQISTDL